MSDKLSELKVANKYTFQGVLLRFANTNSIKNTTYWMPFIFFSFFFTADLPTTISYCAIWIQHAFKPIPSSWARYTFCCSSPGWVNSLTCISTQAVFELLSMATASVSHYQDYGLPSDSMCPFLASLCVWLSSHCRVTPFRIVFSKTVHLIIWLGFNWHFWYRSNFLLAKSPLPHTETR